MQQYLPILNNIKRYVALNASDEQDFMAIISSCKLKKRQCIVQPGTICFYQSYVLQGALRAYFISPEGTEHTLQLAIEDWFISDFYSYITQSPASLYVEALETSVVQQIHYHDVEKLCIQNPKFERFFRMVAQKSFAFAQRRILSNIGKSAEARYLELQAMYPNIVQRIPQYALASYLGITPEFLSNIKRKLIRKT